MGFPDWGQTQGGCTNQKEKLTGQVGVPWDQQAVHPGVSLHSHSSRAGGLCREPKGGGEGGWFFPVFFRVAPSSCGVPGAGATPVQSRRFHFRPSEGSNLLLHVFTFSRLENWVNVLRLSPPATNTQRSLRSERGTPRSAPMHYLRTHAGQGQGRQAGQVADRRKRHSQAGPA